MYKVILMPVDIQEMDLSDKTIAHANFLASTKNCKIHLLHVFPKLYSSPMRGFASDMKKYELFMAEDARMKLTCLAKKFARPLEDIEQSVRFGNTRDEVNKMVEETGADVVIIGSRHPDSAFTMLGSTASGVVRHARVPVLVVR